MGEPQNQGHWRWNVNPTWHHFSAMCQEAHLTRTASNEFFRYHHLRGCLYFAIGAVEAFLNEKLRRKLKESASDEDAIVKRLRQTKLKDKVQKWPSEIVGTDVFVGEEIVEVLFLYNDLRSEVTHPKRGDHSIYRDLDNADASTLMMAVSEYMVGIYEGMARPFDYWLLGWNFVGLNNDHCHPCLINNQQFLHALNAMGYGVPAFDYGRANEWERANMMTLDGFRNIKQILDETAPDIEPRWPRFPLRPLLTRRWWDRKLIMNSIIPPSESRAGSS